MRKTFSVSVVVEPGEAEVVAELSVVAGPGLIQLTCSAGESLKNRRWQEFAGLLASESHREIPRPSCLLCL